MIRRPPRSTLFPTRRSSDLPVIGARGAVWVAAEVHLMFAAFVRWTDRKSTRLNSSHDQISYAVFCLKKKRHNRHLRADPLDAAWEAPARASSSHHCPHFPCA